MRLTKENDSLQETIKNLVQHVINVGIFTLQASKLHVERTIAKSNKNEESCSEDESSKKVGRGGFVTFLSKNTILSIITEIANEIRKKLLLK